MKKTTKRVRLPIRFWQQLRLLTVAFVLAALGLPTEAQMIPFSFWKSQSLFTWMGGPNKNTQTGIYGTLGVSSATNWPGLRSSPFTWTDASGNFWMFGGNGYDTNGVEDVLGDLWKYSPTTGQWTWMSDQPYIDQGGFFGTKGTGSTSNAPGGHNAGVSWLDSSGNLWLFGGSGFDSNAQWGFLNDLWKYNPSNGQWTWMSGSNLKNPSGHYGTKGTGSTSNFPGGRQEASSWMDSSGNLWLFGGYGFDSNGNIDHLNDLWEYTVATGKWTWISGSKTIDVVGTYGALGASSTTFTPGSRTDTAAWTDAAGNFWLFGGAGPDSASNWGPLNELWEFVPSTKKWAWVAGANTTAGATANYGTQGTGSTSNIPGGRQNPAAFKDSSGNFWLFGGDGIDSAGNAGPLNDLWQFNSTTLNWTWVSGKNINSYSGIYGTQGTGSTSNFPGGRAYPGAWVDTSGNFWFLGGFGMDSVPSVIGRQTNLNDLWKYNPSNTQWTWVGGFNVDLQQGTYTTIGNASATNLPTARQSANTWVDSSGNLYLFGGIGPDSQDDDVVAHDLNDFWEYSPATAQWTWLAGSNINFPNIGLPNGIYGTKGTGSTSNLPGGRNLSASWVDSSGNFWMFGGTGFDSAGAYGNLNDLWKYNPSNGQWTWISGTNLVEQTATYGTLGSGSTSNIPGPREGMVQWLDPSGNLWVFGGYAKDSAGNYGDMNDLWKFNPVNLQWTWVSGSNVNSASGTYGTLGTGSTSNIPGGREAASSWTDSAGNLWLFGGLGFDSGANGGTMNDLWKYTPGNNQWTWVAGSNLVGAAGTYGTKGVGSSSNIPGARELAIAWTDGSGNFWLMGGNANDSSGAGVYGNDLWKYTPSTNQWTWTQGSSLGTQSGVYNTLGVTATSSVPGGRLYSNVWRTEDGSVWIFGGWGFDAYQATGYLNDLWKLSP